MVAREGLAVVARLEDARHRLAIPAGIPTADRRGDMTTADRRGSARAVIVLMGIDPQAVAHPVSGLRTTVFLAIAAPPIGRTATAHRVIVFRKIAFPVTVRLVIVPQESDPSATVHQAIVPMDAGMALALSLIHI